MTYSQTLLDDLLLNSKLHFVIQLRKSFALKFRPFVQLGKCARNLV